MSSTNPIWHTTSNGVVEGSRELPHPASVGPYQILSVLGEGGMGTVYVAEQRSPIQRRVALKLIKLGMDTREVIARFETERRSLAQMSHPNIALVYDAGAGDSGEPFFAMEFIDGVPLTQYCDREKLSITDRLELFAQVCDAIQHAHTKGIIHRDIKPGNVIVTEVDGKPTPKVIDFGIAKAIDQQPAERTVFSERGRLIGTPEYMSPEQAGGAIEEVDARTDIYSLGAMLYELLIGMPPFDALTMRSLAFAEIQRIIREVEPARPSTRISKLPSVTAEQLAYNRHKTASSLVRTMGGELEWIPLKAMRKNREHRYRTASELADDVRNYLRGMPLLAGPESRLYLARKFLRRHRSAAATVAIVIIAILTGCVVAGWEAARARHAERTALIEKDIANQQRSIAEQRFGDVKTLSNRLLVELLPDVDKLAGSTPAIRKLVDMSLQYLAGLQAEKSDDVSLMKDVARGYAMLGDVQGNPFTKNFGDPASALESYKKTIHFAEKAISLDPNSATAISALGTGELKAGDVLNSMGRRQESIDHYLRARDLFAKAAILDPTNFVSCKNPLVAEERLASAQLNMGETKVPLQSLTANLENARKVDAKFPTNEHSRDTLLEAMHSLASAQSRNGAYDDANATLNEEIQLREHVLQTNRDNVFHQRDLAHALLSLVELRLTRYADFAGTEPQLDRAVELYQHGYDADPTDLSGLLMLARSLNVQKDLLLHTHREGAALKSAQREVDLLKKGLALAPDDGGVKQNLIVALGSMADVYQKQNRLQESLQMRKDAVAELMTLYSANPSDRTLQAGLGFMRRQTAETMIAMRQYQPAIIESQAAVEIFGILSEKTPDNRAFQQQLKSATAVLETALNGGADDPSLTTQDRSDYRKRANALEKTDNRAGP